MNQQANNRTTGLIIGILMLVLSLPMSWLTIRNPTVTGDLALNPFFKPSSITTTGFDGNIGIFSMTLPVWLVVTVGILSLVLWLMNQRGVTSLPKVAFVALWAVSMFYVLLPFGLVIFSEQVSLNFGPFLALFGLGLGFLSGLSELRKPQQRESRDLFG